MTFDIMDQREVHTPSCFFEERCFPLEKGPIGFWKANSIPDHHARDHKEKFQVDGEGPANISGISKMYGNNPREWSNPYAQLASYGDDSKRANVNVIQYEGSLFSSLLSESFTTKSAGYEIEEPFECPEEIQLQTIENLLPDENDLFSGDVGQLGCTSYANGLDDVADFDLFSSVGGIELEGESCQNAGQGNCCFTGGIANIPGCSGGCRSPDDHSLSEVITTDSHGVMIPGYMDDGFIHGLYSPRKSSIGEFRANVLPHGSLSVPNSLPSPVKMTFVSSQIGNGVPSHSLNKVKLCKQCNPAFGSSGSGSCPIHGHHLWSKSHSIQHYPQIPMFEPNSPLFVNGIHAQYPGQLPRLSRAKFQMPNTAPAQQHHFVSAPAGNLSCCDRRSPYRGGSHETADFYLGCCGSIGVPGSLLLHPSEVASHNMFSHVSGNGMDISRNAASEQTYHIFSRRKSVTSLSNSFGSPNERMRNLSRRRSDTNSSFTDKKQYELDIDVILRGEDSRTTLMIKNIPNKYYYRYNSKMLLAAIDEQHRGTYDFVYLPIDFKNKCNVGYAFINMIDPLPIIPFHKAFDGKKWEKFNSEKVASLAYARIQGKAALISHFQNSSLMNEDKRCRPILFYTDGPNAGDQEPFPIGTNMSSGLSKFQGNFNENEYLGSPSSFVKGEESSDGTDSSSGSAKDAV